MPRARRMPRTRALRALRGAIPPVVLGVVTGGQVVVVAAGRAWFVALLVLVAAGAGLVALAGRAARAIDERRLRALGRDWEGLTVEERSLPYGVVRDEDGALLLPTKISVTVAMWLVTAVMLALAIMVVLAGEPAALAVGAVLLGLAGYLGVIAWWVTGTRIRLTADGVETRMGPRRSYRWLDVPDLKVEHTNIVVLRAAGAPRPRVWLRTGVLEVATGDCVWLVRELRGW